MLRLRKLALLAVVAAASGALPYLASADHGNADEAFERTWQRADLPVVTQVVERTWMWGPVARTGILHETYAESPGGLRSVQYYDKSRMEVTYADADEDAVWYVTNGLLVVELMTGRLQLGDNTFEPRTVADVNVAGDADDPSGPTYSTMGRLMDAPAADVGAVLTGRLSRAGTVSDDPSLAAHGITAAQFVPATSHTIAEPFWDFMNAAGPVFEDGSFVTANLILDVYFATGLPVTEAYWADVRVGGETKLVLMQCFERRCLTYTPDNEPGWQVEAGNVGLHYYDWRYRTSTPLPPPMPDCEPRSGRNHASDSMRQPVFTNQDLACADFSGASITQGNFFDASAPLSDFDGARLVQPHFRSTALDGASFRNARLIQPVFEGASAVNANFSGSRLVQPAFIGANLLGAEMRTAVIVMPTFRTTICPDGANSDQRGGTCLGNLAPFRPSAPMGGAGTGML